MRVTALVSVVRQSLWRSRVSLGLAAFGVGVGIAAFAFFLALSAGMRGAVRDIFPVDRLEVVRASSESGGALSLLGGEQPSLAAADLRSIREIRGVGDAQPRMRMAFPVKAWGGEKLLRATRYTELIGDGIPSELVDDLGPNARFEDRSKRSSRRVCRNDSSCPSGEYCHVQAGESRCEQYVPAIFSPFLLEMYNEFLAKRGDLPHVSRWMVDRVKGISFRVMLGESYMGRADCGGRERCEPREVVMQLVGVSRHAAEIGVTVPISYVEEWNREFAGDAASKAYSSVSVRVASEREVTPVVSQLARLGYEVRNNRAEQAGVTITIVTVLLALASVLVIVIAGVNIAHTFFSLVHERRSEIGLYRALGATRSDVRQILLTEAALVGIVAGAAGLGASVALAKLCDFLWVERIPDFPFKPESLFSYSFSLVGLAMGFAVVCCVVGAYLPARRAARLDPARALS